MEIHKKKRVIIIGGGSSAKELVDAGLWEHIKGEEIWSINFAFMVMPYLPSRELWVDVRFFSKHMEYLQKLHYSGVPCFAKAHTKYMAIPEIHQIETTPEASEANKKVFVGQLRLSGIFSLHLALKERFEEIYLIGFDFGTTNPKDKFTHFYQKEIGDKIDSTGVAHPELYQTEDAKRALRDFEYFCSPEFEKSKIFNVSINSAIPYFEKLTKESFFERIKNGR
jgi:hypothetical protein